MNKYSFVFTIADFDVYGEEHRLAVTPHCIRPEDGLKMAVTDLVKFAAKILGCKPDEFAAKRILLKSAWCDRKRITSRELLDAMMKAGFAGKGREEQRIEHTPRDWRKQMDRARQRRK